MKWEYKSLKLGTKGLFGGKIDEVLLDRMMNELGGQGWELASAFDTEEAAGRTKDVVVIFKRPKG
jgi:hypothetical protein